MSLRFRCAMLAGKLTAGLIRLIDKERGTRLPGVVALKVDPQLLRHIKGVTRENTVFVTGTNGKSTTTNLIAHALLSAGRRVVCNFEGANLESGVVSTLLKHRIPELAQYFPPTEHCLFGLHLLREVGGIGIVESERSAVILSELYPSLLWLATAHPANATVDRFEPLQGHPVTLFPRTDDTMSTYLSWVDLADHAECLYHLDITVDDTLEKHATPEQKARCIDLVDFISDNS